MLSQFFDLIIVNTMHAFLHSIAACETKFLPMTLSASFFCHNHASSSCHIAWRDILFSYRTVELCNSLDESRLPSGFYDSWFPKTDSPPMTLQYLLVDGRDVHCRASKADDSRDDNHPPALTSPASLLQRKARLLRSFRRSSISTYCCWLAGDSFAHNIITRDSQGPRQRGRSIHRHDCPRPKSLSTVAHEFC